MPSLLDDRRLRETTAESAINAPPGDAPPGDAAIGSAVDDVLRRRLWFAPNQVRVRVERGTVVLTGDVGRSSTAAIAARLAGAVRGVTTVVNRIGFAFDDDALVRSRIGRTHPFSADPFPAGPEPRRRRIRLPRRRGPRPGGREH